MDNTDKEIVESHQGSVITYEHFTKVNSFRQGFLFNSQLNIQIFQKKINHSETKISQNVEDKELVSFQSIRSEILFRVERSTDSSYRCLKLTSSA